MFTILVTVVNCLLRRACARFKSVTTKQAKCSLAYCPLSYMPEDPFKVHGSQRPIRRGTEVFTNNVVIELSVMSCR